MHPIGETEEEKCLRVCVRVCVSESEEVQKLARNTFERMIVVG